MFGSILTLTMDSGIVEELPTVNGNVPGMLERFAVNDEATINEEAVFTVRATKRKNIVKRLIMLGGLI